MKKIQVVKQSQDIIQLLHSSIRAGVILGFISTGFTYSVYFIDFSLLASGLVGFGSLAIILGVVIYSGIQYRNELGGFMTFDRSFNFSFIALVTSALISSIASILLFNVIDPNLPIALGNVQLEKTLAMMDRFGMGSKMSIEQMNEIRLKLYDNFKVAGVVNTFGLLILGSTFFALIIGAFIKKKDQSLDY